MRIHITYTGGTIGMIDSPNGLIPGADTPAILRLLAIVRASAALIAYD